MHDERRMLRIADPVGYRALPDQPLLLRAEEAARLRNIGRSKVFEMMAAGERPGVVRLGRAVRISREALERWIREQGGEAA